MAQLLFRSTDTISWLEAFSDGSYGALTISSPTTDSTPNTSCVGTLSSNTLTVNSFTGFADGDLILIHQTRNGGDGAGNWQLNKIASGGSTTTWALTYALTHNYNTTAQVILLRKTSSYAINDTFTIRSWNGSTGGLGVIFSNGTVNGSGTIDLKGVNDSQSAKGFRGQGSTGAGNIGFQGEGTSGGGGTRSNSANGNGGGGGMGGSGGGGGGNGSVGTVGQDFDASNHGGVGGASVGSSDLTTIVLGGGGGSGGSNGGNAGDSSVSGGAILIVIAPNIDFSSMTLITANGGSRTVVDSLSEGSGGGGAGGSVCLQGGTINVGTSKITASGGSGGVNSGSGGNGGAGSVGRIYARYATSIAGTTSPTLVSEQDVSISTTTSTSTTVSTSTTISTTTTMSVTTSTSTTSTSSSTSTTSTSTTSTSSSTSLTSTSSTMTTTTITLPFHLDIDRGR